MGALYLGKYSKFRGQYITSEWEESAFRQALVRVFRHELDDVLGPDDSDVGALEGSVTQCPATAKKMTGYQTSGIVCYRPSFCKLRLIPLKQKRYTDF